MYEQLVPNETGEKRQECLFAIGRNYLREEESLKAEQVFEENYDYIPAKLLWNRLLVKTGRAGQALPFIEDFLHAPQFTPLSATSARSLPAAGTTRQGSRSSGRHRAVRIADSRELQHRFPDIAIPGVRTGTSLGRVPKTGTRGGPRPATEDYCRTTRQHPRLSFPYTMVLLTKAAEIASARGDATLLASLLAELESPG
ncbi:MAG: hypothetical protein R3C12_00295 [Planctomycetaceae bacterium]